MAKSRAARSHRGSTTGKYMSAEQTGRYTRPIPKDVRHSPKWLGPLVLVLLLGGVFLLVGNYLLFLPGAANAGYLIAGLIAIFAGFGFATRLK